MVKQVGLPAAAGTAVLVLALQGCLGAPKSDASVENAAQPSPSGSAAGESFAWVPFGPAEANAQSSWYRSLEEGKCSGVTNQENDMLVQAVAAVCRAAIEKQQGDWAMAQQLSDQMTAPPTGQQQQQQQQRGTSAPDCLDQAALALLTRALAWHASHPNTDPTVTLPQAGQPVACEFKVNKVAPNQGPVSGGTQVEITGVGLNEVSGVSFGDKAVNVESTRTEDQGGVTVDIIKVTTPAGANPGPVDVTVKNRAGNAVAPKAFTYTAGGSTASASPTTTGRPTRSPSPSVGPSTPSLAPRPDGPQQTGPGQVPPS